MSLFSIHFPLHFFLCIPTCASLFFCSVFFCFCPLSPFYPPSSLCPCFIVSLILRPSFSSPPSPCPHFLGSSIPDLRPRLPVSISSLSSASSFPCLLLHPLSSAPVSLSPSSSSPCLLHPSSSSPPAFVTLLNGTQAQDAIRSLHHSTVRGRCISVALQPTDSLLCLANLPHTFTGQQFEELVRAYGNIERCFLVYSELTGHSKGYGFVEYMKKDSASRARSELLGRPQVPLLHRDLRWRWGGVDELLSGCGYEWRSERLPIPI